MRVPPQDQYPQLPNGCEVTALSMLLTAVGHPVGKMTLAREMPRDPTPRRLGAGGKILSWGDPEVGFVGNVYVAPDGYGIYHRPMIQLLNRILPGRAEDLTHEPFRRILEVVAQGTPVELWTTFTLRPTRQWLTWQSPEGPIRATLLEHAVLLVGYRLGGPGGGTLYLNNPGNGRQAQPVPMGPFLAAWRQLGEQAITVRPASEGRAQSDG